MSWIDAILPMFAVALSASAFAAPGGPGFVPAVQQGRGALATSGVRALAASGGPGFVPAVKQGRGALATSGVRAHVASAEARNPIACGFHASPYADWMVNNTIPRLVWYVSAVPFFALVCRRERGA